MFAKDVPNQVKIEKLDELLSRKRKILILTHNNPDPDSLAAAWALKYLFHIRCRVDSVVAYGGIIGRAENRAMVKYLGMGITPLSQVTIKNFSVIALVDSQPGAGNTLLPKSILPTIVIDHHRPLRALTKKVPFADIRTEYGSTSTIVTEYLKEAEIPNIDRNVATALLYGIKSDTRDLGRGTGPKDMDAFLFLYPRVRFKTLSKIEKPVLSRTHFKIFDRTLKTAVIYRDVVVSIVDDLDTPDSLAEMADLLIRMDGVRWSLCVGVFEDNVYFSVRTTNMKNGADRVVQNMVKRIGSAGGHEMVAAGKIECARVAGSDCEGVIQTLITRFLAEVEREGIEGKPL
jgi:nanoRNase/pAp phosphatase (c-di-AMP/oligoRNAs hydrolase)